MKKLTKFWPLLIILAVWVVLFWPFFSKRLLPIPADIITGVYYPWLDYKWGYEVGVPVKNPLMSDVPSLLYPWRSFVIDELKAGRWPLWNPYYFLGMPLLANFQSAVFSYVNIFFLFLPKSFAWSAGVMTSSLLTMLAMYFFLRHKNLSKISSLLGGIVFSLSGFEIAWMEYNVHGHTALFLPLILIGIDKILGQKKNIWLFFVSIFVAFQIFAGYIPIVIYSYLICLFYIVYFYFLPEIRKEKIFWKKYLLLILFWLISLGMASIQILPGLELTVNSIRKIDPIVSASGASYLPIKNLVTFIAPDFFGNPATGNYFGKAFYDNFYLFVGTGTLLLIFYSLFFIKKSKNILFWWLLVLFSFILIFKNTVGIFLEKLLFLSGGVSARAIFILDFSLALLSAYGFDLFIKSDNRNRKKIIYSIIFVAVSSLVCVRSAVFLSRNFQIVAMRNLAIPFLILFFCSTILLTMIKFPKKIIRLLFLLTVSFQLLYSAKKYLPFSKQELLFPRTPVIDFLLVEKSKTKEPFRVELGEVIPQNFLMPYGIETTSGYDALLPMQTGRFLTFLETGKIQDKISRVHLIRNFDSLLFLLTNTKYILAKKINEKGIYSSNGEPPQTFKRDRFKLVFEDRTVQVYEDKRYLPRANFILGKSLPMDLYELANHISKERFNNNVGIKWLDYAVDRKTLEVKTEEDGYLILTDSNFTGWSAFVNERETPTEENFPFLAIKTAKGNNIIRFIYNPKSFYFGRIISLVSLVIFAFLTIVFLIQKKWKKR